MSHDDGERWYDINGGSLTIVQRWVMAELK